ncbi:hypothetical protein DEO72_LG6g1349 [Vigna unguiculata]|uniref:Uncharacterized protein n=1 Tax=Vigna unguiculata TaxID=3917 RepID=A0A4D6M5R9_VIGUN|nr:hypothetical protein DEO72_LG6g1349 [Vigna unguiculata]
MSRGGLILKPNFNSSLPSLHFTNDSFSSLLPTHKIPAAGATAASPTAGETHRRRRQPPPEASPTGTQLPKSSPSSFLLSRKTGPDPGAPPSHTMSVQPRVRQLQPPRPRLPPRRHCHLQRAPSEMPVATTFLLWFHFFDLCWVVMTNRRDGL